MLDMTRSGYGGFCSPLMISSYQEQLACNGNLDHFNWFRVSPFDPRIRKCSEWLDPTRNGKLRLKNAFISNPFTMSQMASRNILRRRCNTCPLVSILQACH